MPHETFKVRHASRLHCCFLFFGKWRRWLAIRIEFFRCEWPVSFLAVAMNFEECRFQIRSSLPLGPLSATTHVCQLPKGEWSWIDSDESGDFP